MRQAATVMVAALAVWLVIRSGLGSAAAAFYAGFVSGCLACVLAVALVPPRAERLARHLGIRVRAAVDRPSPRVPRPASTPIHDKAARRQNGD
jgi:hypothetical protein